MEQQTSRSLANRQAGLRLLAVAPAAHKVLGFVAQQLRLPHATVADLVQRAPCVLPISANDADVSRIRDMLMTVGLRVERVDDPGDALNLTLFADVCPPRDDLVAAVAQILDHSAQEVRAALFSPFGLTLALADPASVTQLARKLRRIGNLTVVQSTPATSTYDVFSGTHLPSGLVAHLRFLGLIEDPVTQAIGSGLDHRMVRHLQRLFPAACILDRAVQRFDLWLVRSVDWQADDLADFLMARTGLPRVRFDTVSTQNPIRIETALPRQSALRFRADYAAMGLQTCLCLTQPGAEN